MLSLKHLPNVVCLFAFGLHTALAVAGDPLASWEDTSVKRRIIAFVKQVVTPGSPSFISEAERIAVFDNDGTLWAEQPIYPQLAFTLDRVREIAKNKRSLNYQDPYQAVIDNDREKMAVFGSLDWLRLIAATHTGMSSEAFSETVEQWIGEARHPRFDRPYTETVFQPMVELIAYLKSNGFKCYIVSGGEVGFMRPWTEKTYGVPPEQVIGSTLKTEFLSTEQGPIIKRDDSIDLIVDGDKKPVAIDRVVGRRPIFAAGNSDGDYEMLQWTSASSGPSLCLLIRHTDADREYAYDRNSKIGKLDRALRDAAKNGWQVVDMKEDWRVIFPPTGNPDSPAEPETAIIPPKTL